MSEQDPMSMANVLYQNSILEEEASKIREPMYETAGETQEEMNDSKGGLGGLSKALARKKVPATPPAENSDSRVGFVATPNLAVDGSSRRADRDGNVHRNVHDVEIGSQGSLTPDVNIRQAVRDSLIGDQHNLLQNGSDSTSTNNSKSSKAKQRRMIQEEDDYIQQAMLQYDDVQDARRRNNGNKLYNDKKNIGNNSGMYSNADRRSNRNSGENGYHFINGSEYDAEQGRIGQPPGPLLGKQDALTAARNVKSARFIETLPQYEDRYAYDDNASVAGSSISPRSGRSNTNTFSTLASGNLENKGVAFKSHRKSIAEYKYVLDLAIWLFGYLAIWLFGYLAILPFCYLANCDVMTNHMKFSILKCCRI
jgi:hypothetical protein